ncbi:GtrA family protein [Nocardia cyriacigeorgica]|uniref:GtrA family protein n=1 Tax=Nocardia cyriacigeorgica TaxID=135487 RepID=UPI0018955E19|nr:GtrA family protein [Nocardia cyriacigeorgica]MBF6083450.1 GtrA family protein [Nocardia cyriacigeorgica]
MHDLAAATDTLAERFTRLCESVVARLPWGLDRIVAPTLLGFALINSFTFGVDLVLLTTLHSGFGLPLWLSVTVGYVCAFGLAFLLNRTFNFHSHAPIGRQAVVYAVVVLINYLVFILGVSTGLAELGVEYHLSRLVAGACEAVYMYSAMRWVVFRRRAEPVSDAAGAGGQVR